MSEAPHAPQLNEGQKTMVFRYDRSMTRATSTFFGRMKEMCWGKSDFYNWGYWTPTTKNQLEASQNLVERLLSFIPDPKGNILDVACGLGATTRQLMNHYAPQDIVAINISETQLARGREIAPGCTFIYMDAVHLDFPDASFDNIICVEAAFHFDSRDDFLREAYRVLKPGGRLVHSDILMRRFMYGGRIGGYQPKPNYLEDPADLRQHILAAGFEKAEVMDETEACWGGFRRTLKEWPAQARADRRITRFEYFTLVVFSKLFRLSADFTTKYYALSWAEKAPV